ncbi:GNAT family N-acetyltransferase [Candidatus Woesebacteria bacterium]|nr:GNAT family N-acetyltransferase [Candidatus Woesebacteria bacterium]
MLEQEAPVESATPDKPNLHEMTSPGVMFEHITDPRTLLIPETIAKYGLDELIVQGYGVAESSEAQEQLKIEYGEATDVILALDSAGKAIGSLALRRLKGEDGSPTIEFQRKVEGAFPKKAGRPVLHVNGIVVQQTYRSHGVGRNLMTQAIDLIRPSLIVGETKTPEAVAIRMHLGESYFGYKPVGDAPQMNESVRDLVDAYVKLNEELLGTLWRDKAIDYDCTGVFYVSNKYLPTDVPRPRPELVGVFHDVCELQESENKRGSGKTAVAPIITIID